MVFSKKGLRIRNNLISVGMDYSINKILSNYHIPFGITIQNIIAYHPYEVVLSLLALKLGITNKIILSVIIAFLL
jgi:hypothetical protein